MIVSCDAIGRNTFERLRVRAILLLLRFAALRISDVATLARDRIRNGKPVRLPLHPELRAALDVLPLPRGANGDENCKYFFWSGNGGTDAVIRDVRRTMEAVYEKSGVAGACSHRFRHTLATEVLEMGGSIEEAADILGDSPAIIVKHYVKWTRGRQARISDLLSRIWKNSRDVLATQENDDQETFKNELDGVVDLERFELSTSSMPWKRAPNCATGP
jgi:integrase